MTNLPEHPFIGTETPAIPNMHRFAHSAMATVYEFIIHHPDASYAFQAAHAAAKYLDELELELSRFVENSDVNRINRHGAEEPVKVGPATIECLIACNQHYLATGRAFDITAGNLIEVLKQFDSIPIEYNVAKALSGIGMGHVTVDPENLLVSLDHPDTNIDLGGFGKGYAVDQLAALLEEWDLDTFLIHGGASSVITRGSPGKKGWDLSLSSPAMERPVIYSLILNNMALGGSGLVKGNHVIDPRSGQPVMHHLAAWVMAPDAATADALSTAFLVLTVDEIEEYVSSRKNIGALVLKYNKLLHDFGTLRQAAS